MINMRMMALVLCAAATSNAGAVGEAAPEPKVVPPTKAVWNPNLSETDPGTLDPSEVYKVLQAEPRCTFRYTEAGPAVLVAGRTDDGGDLKAVIKLHGRLVVLTPVAATEFEGIIPGDTFEAEGIVARVMPEVDAQQTTEDGEPQWPAEMRFKLDEGLSVGYKGWYSCEP